MAGQGGSRSGRLLGSAASLLVSAVLLHWAYDIIRPMLVWLIVGVAVIVAGKVLLHFHRRW